MKKLLACLALAVACAAQADTTLDYNVLHAGKKSGAQKTVIKDDGRMHVSYSYRDNGRGPDIEEDIAVLPDKRVLMTDRRGGRKRHTQQAARTGRQAAATSATGARVGSTHERKSTAGQHRCRQRRRGGTGVEQVELVRLAEPHAERTDIPVLMAIMMLTAVMVVFFNLLADVAYAFLDPRIRYG